MKRVAAAATTGLVHRPLGTAHVAGALDSSTATTNSAAAPSVDKMHVLMYSYVEGIIEKRAPHRAAHLAHAQRYADQGRMVAGGAWEDASGAMFVFRTVTADDVHHFAQEDPYVRAGLITRHEVRPWLVVIGTAKKDESS